MDDDLDLGRVSTRKPKRRSGWIAAAAVFVVLGGVGAVLWQMRDRVAEIALTIGSPDAGVERIEPTLDAGESSIPSIPRADSDALLRRVLAGGSPLLVSWLAADGIVQRLAAAAQLVAIGRSPRPVLSFIEIDDDFQVIEVDGRIFIAPEAYARYDTFTKAVTSIGAAEAGRAYVEVRPHFDAAFSQVARPGERFDDVFVRAIERSVAVPIPDGRVEVVEAGAIYAFKDPSLESLSAAEKHFLRMGPDNMRALATWLETFSRSAGLRR